MKISFKRSMLSFFFSPGASFQFTCPREWCVCNTTTRSERIDRKMRGIEQDSCPFTRKIKLIDTLLFTNASVAKMVDNLHEARENEKLSLAQVFPSCRQYADSMNYTQEQFEAITNGKWLYPYEFGGKQNKQGQNNVKSWPIDASKSPSVV